MSNEKKKKNDEGLDLENLNVYTEGEAAGEEKKKPEHTSEKEKRTKENDKEKQKAEKEIEGLKAELKEAGEKYLRMMAEYDNFRKRAAKEREGVYADAYADAISAILPVIDNLERAVAFAGEGKAGEGLKLTFNQFEEALKKMGVTETEALGKTFDPMVHNAVMHVDDEKYGVSEIVEVFQKGYKKGDKIIRYAAVKVAN